MNKTILIMTVKKIFKNTCLRTYFIPYLQFSLEKRKVLALFGNLMPNQLSPNMGLYYVALPHIPYPEHETGHPVSVVYHSVPGEEEGLGPLLGPGKFGEHYPHHEGLDHNSADALDAHDEDRFRALLRGGPDSVSDGVLSLHTE